MPALMLHSSAAMSAHSCMLRKRGGAQSVCGVRVGRAAASRRASTRVTAAAATKSMPLGQSSKADEMLTMEQGYCLPFRKYSPDALARRATGSPVETVKTLARGIEVLSKFGVYALSLASDRAFGLEDQNVPLRAAQVRDLLCDLGPTYIKAGQVLASRPDIVRADYMEELTTLQDDVPAFPNKEAFEIIEREMGRPLEDVFESISERPIAAASLGQVYKGVLKSNGKTVAVKVQRPEIEPVIYRDLWLLRTASYAINTLAIRRLGCNATLIIDEFGEKLLEELDYKLEARNLQDFYVNFYNDQYVKIPECYREISTGCILVMEWIDGIRCTDPAGIKAAGIDVDEFIRVGVVSGMRQLLEFGLFHGDPHPGNVFAMTDGRIAYVDFGNVAQLSQRNKEVLIDAVVHAVNEDYEGMADDFIQLGFLAPGTDLTPIVPALKDIWSDARTRSMVNFNFRTVTSSFNRLVYQYPIRIPERFSLVIRSLLTQEGICMTLQPEFRFLEVAYPYVAKRLLTDSDSTLRDRLLQVLFNKGNFQWARLENLISLATQSSGGLDLTDTVLDGAKVVIADDALRTKLLLALTQGNRLQVNEVARLVEMLQRSAGLQPEKLMSRAVTEAPDIARTIMLSWSQRVLA